MCDLAQFPLSYYLRDAHCLITKAWGGSCSEVQSEVDDADDGRWWARRQGARAPPYLPAVRYGPILSPYYYVTNK